MPADVSGAGAGGGGGSGGGAYGGVHAAEPVAAMEVVGDQQLLLERAVSADRNNRRECGETAEARRAVVREPPLALFLQDVEHRDCVPQTAVHILARPLSHRTHVSTYLLLDINVPERQRDQEHLELFLGRGQRQQHGEDVVHAVDSRSASH